MTAQEKRRVSFSDNLVYSPKLSKNNPPDTVNNHPMLPSPLENFKSFSETQKELFISESDEFFKRHSIHMRKNMLPTKLPDWADSAQDILNSEDFNTPYATIYRHRHFLKCRILRNWSYIETPWNSTGMKRNNGIPYDLRPLTKEITKHLDSLNEDLTDPEFTGMLLTLNSATYKQSIQNKSFQISKILAGGVVECLSTNERCIKCIWVHPDLSQHSSKILLQVFLPRLILESFSINLDSDTTNPKFTYAMHNDMDLFPRQCWLLLASAKRLCLPRHYESSNFEDHDVELDYGGYHTDIDQQNFEKVYNIYGNLATTKNVECLCRKRKEEMPKDDQAWLDRLIGCTENFMSIMLPKKSERAALGLFVRDGWRDMVPNSFEQGLYLNIMKLLPSSVKAKVGIPLLMGKGDKTNTNIQNTVSSRNSSNSNQVNTIASSAMVDLNQEWCELKKDDLEDITSDTEYTSKSPKNMSLVGISRFSEEIFNLEATLPEYTLKTPDNSKFRIISFYQSDVDGLCAQYIFQLHSNFKSFASLHSFPVNKENDIYHYIRKTLSLHLKRPDVQANAYIRVLLIGIRGWSGELLRALKIHFEHLLDPPLRPHLKIAILTVSRPIGFFGQLPDQCIIFTEGDTDFVGSPNSLGTFTSESVSVASLLLKGMTFAYENEHAAALFVASIGIFSKNAHFGIGESLYYGKIDEIHNQITQLNCGPYVSYDIDKAILPLVTFTSLEDALSISPSILVFDSKKNPETIAEFRIQCSLKKEEFSAEFNSLSAEKQKKVLSMIKDQITFYREMPQLCWLRRVKHIPNLDVMYFLSAILNKNDIESIVALDFLYNILQERLQQDSYYDRNVLPTVTKSTISYMHQSYDAVRVVNTGQRIIIAIIHPNAPLTHINQLEMVASLISNIQAKGDEVKRLRCLLNIEREEKQLFGFSPNVDTSFPDIWPNVFMHLAETDSTVTFNALLPNLITYKGEFQDVKKTLFSHLVNLLGKKLK